MFFRTVRNASAAVQRRGIFSAVTNNGSLHNFNFRKVVCVRSFAVITEPLEPLGDSITTAVLLQWSKVPGEAIKEDDVIAVVETDKVT